MPTPIDFSARRAAFAALHQRGCFLMPNPWDAGSARFLEQLGFAALASTSSGLAFSRGLPDGARALSREVVLAHLAELVAATGLPINADFESGYADDADGVADSVRRCVATGVAGLSIEDATGDAAQPLFDLPVAVERLRAARAAIDASGSGVILTARAECFLVGHPRPLEESLVRLQAYAEAGADVLFAPGVETAEQISAVVAAVAPRPVNVLMGDHSQLRLADLEALGVRRVSVGSALARTAWTGFARAARTLARDGDFSAFDGNLPFAELNELFAAGSRRR